MTDTPRHGVLADSDLDALATTGHIRGGVRQPASLDLPLGRRGYQIQASFLPRGRRVEDAVADVALEPLEIPETGYIVMPGTILLVELDIDLALPEHIQARANPKSSTGRLDIFVRVLSDRSAGYDEVPAGYAGRLWLEIAPRSFPIRIRPGIALAQIRFKIGRPELDDAGLQAMIAEGQLVGDTDLLVANGLCMGIHLAEPADTAIGYRARRNSKIIDLGKVRAYDARDFWEPVYARDGKVILEADAFYILASRERIGIGPMYSAEMMPFDSSVGEFRVHYAGFFDPGFGWGNVNLARGVLEVRPHDVPVLIEHGQTMARLVFERMLTIPKAHYGEPIGSNYNGQGIALAKHFYKADRAD